MAKEEMIGLRERVLTHMADLSLMQKPLEREVRVEVIPWLNNKITGYIRSLHIFNNHKQMRTIRPLHAALLASNNVV